MGSLIKVENLFIKRQNTSILENVSFNLEQGQQLLITSNAGGGKTSLGLALAGKLFYDGKISYDFTNLKDNISFVDQLYKFKSKSGLTDFYYQQRYNSFDAEDSATIREVLDGHDSKLIEELSLSHRLDAPLVQLSSGERKKIQLIQALQSPKKIIILDNPYIGLDHNSVTNLNNLFAKLSINGTSFIILGDVEEIPSFITHIAQLTNQTIHITPVTQYRKPVSTPLSDTAIAKLPELEYIKFNKAIEFNNISIAYGTKKILENISWTVNQGEKWLLRGANGAGKTTLLSLINGDHPQSYANDMYLFDRKRGSGESIWDIKHKIGFISPEIHWNFNYEISCLEVVVSGLYDTLGIYKRPKPEELEIARTYIKYLGLENFQDKKFMSASTGIQRIILIARALVKNPPLLIFDEPCQGLDEEQSRHFIRLVDKLFADGEHTIIYVSHRQDQIPKCINKVIHLENGGYTCS